HQYVVADSGYLQGEYRINSQWSTVARIESAFRDRHDRDGREFAAANPGMARTQRFQRDLMVGVSWRYGEHWGLWGEYHWIDGTQLLQKPENPQPLVSHWSLLMVMAGFKF